MNIMGMIPSSGYNPARIALNPSDPDYLKKLGIIGAVEGQHELNAPPPPIDTMEGVTESPGPTKPEQPAIQTLMQKAKMIHSRPLRILGEIGTGALGAGEALGEAIFPTVAERIPGSITETANRKANEFKQGIEQQTLEQKPELAQLRGEIQGELEASKEAAAQQRVDTQQAGATERTKLTAGEGTPEFFQDPKGNVVQGYKTKQGEFKLLGGESLPQGYIPYKATPGTGKPIQGSVNNEPKWGVYDPKQGWLDPVTKQPIPDFAPPPSWAEVMPETHTISLLDPTTGIPTTYQYNPLTKSFSHIAGQTATGAYAHEEAQAGAVSRAGQALEQTLTNAPVGTIQSWAKSYLLGTPIADPKLAGIDSQLLSFAALNPAMHAFRSTNAMEAFEKIVGGLAKNPQATIESINGILKTTHAINPNLPETGRGEPSTVRQGPTVGTVEDGYRFKGGDPSKESSWEKVK